MQKFTINKGFDEEQTVEAETYGIQDGYFHFADEERKRVFSIRTERVATVERAQS
ncbi:hypothetical protein [Arthrobacter sp. StoSoilB20]|uniref:hypothetical protein n=1 Tax=Arthrobacter sp. StoSoilB20 TaxID=2830995 RepID=UPI001CC3B39C|nr:hypothetical protein [Arthrobacter sp. StoSoilB20]BCW59580.1 hypothetical protein StoSoilB20_29270 [Arthrobacter sp. StoSoilB20]